MVMKDQNKQDTQSAETMSSTTTAKPLTVAEQVWNEIKDKQVLMFALPNQKISDYCQPVPIDPARCFLIHRTGALIPALEESIGPNYQCESIEKYIVVSRKPKNAF
jgi:hypothetical protein